MVKATKNAPDIHVPRKHRLDCLDQRNPHPSRNEVYKVYTGELRYEASPIADHTAELKNKLGHKFTLRLGKGEVGHEELGIILDKTEIEVQAFDLLLKMVR